jgi:predicted acylesterase/phospholipase RssA
MSTTQSPTKTIKHIVISGGGETGFAYYGTFRESNLRGFWDIKNIVSIHSTSAGSIFATFLPLIHHIGWDEFDTFIYKRPWDQVFKFSLNQIMNLYSNIGIMNRKTIYDVFYPIFMALDISMDITMEEFHEYTGIEMHFYTTELDSFQLVDVSYKTHPHWKVVDAVYASSALPILLNPAPIDGKTYIDGGVFCNYPLKQCMEMTDDEDEIFALKKCYPIEFKTDTNYLNLIEYINDIFAKMFAKLSVSFESPEIKNCVKFMGEYTTAYSVYKIMSSLEDRIQMIELGKTTWNEFYENTYLSGLGEGKDELL